MTTWTTPSLRPLSEGANIESWIGFKHFSYLAEAGIQEYLRGTGHSQDEMLRCGTNVDIASFSLRLPSPLYADSRVDIEVEGERATPDEVPGVLRIKGYSRDTETRCFEGKALLKRYATEDLEGVLTRIQLANESELSATRSDAPGRHDWHFTVPYPFCRAATVMQFDGYVRLVEESIERFLRKQDISVRRLLVERGWIPVVTSWKIDIHEPAYMEETLLISMDVTNIFKGLLWDTDISFHTVRNGSTLEIAKSTITHGYAVTKGTESGTMATFDDDVMCALGGK